MENYIALYEVDGNERQPTPAGLARVRRSLNLFVIRGDSEAEAVPAESVLSEVEVNGLREMLIKYTSIGL